MTADHAAKIALLFRGNRDMRAKVTAENNRLSRIFEAFANLNVAAEPAVYADELMDEVRERLMEVDGVIVWVNPIQDGQDRTKLDAMLREVCSAGVWVSAHPDVILKMGHEGDPLPDARLHLGDRHAPVQHGRRVQGAVPAASCIRWPTRPQAESRERRRGNMEGPADRWIK